MWVGMGKGLRRINGNEEKYNKNKLLKNDCVLGRVEGLWSDKFLKKLNR